MTEVLLDVRHLVVEYARPGEKRLRAVDGVSFTLVKGAALGIVGESGCGKSSLARAILQLEDYSGDVTLLGKNLRKLRFRELRSARRHMQAVFQDPLGSLDPRMIVARILEEPLALHCPKLNATARHEKMLAMLARVGLDSELALSYPHELSGGQCQRVAIARAVICEPDLVICDEPVSALDMSIRGQILGLLATLRRDLGIGMIFIAHDMTAVRYLCDAVLVMDRGKIMETGSRDAIFEAPAHPRTRKLLAAVLPPDPDAQPPRDDEAAPAFSVGLPADR